MISNLAKSLVDIFNKSSFHILVIINLFYFIIQTITNIFRIIFQIIFTDNLKKRKEKYFYHLVQRIVDYYISIENHIFTLSRLNFDNLITIEFWKKKLLF